MIEIRVFSLASGVAEEEFLRADVAVQTEFAPFQPGFIRRTTARGERENTWLVLTLWRDAETAREASEAMVSDPVGGAFRALVDPATERVALFSELGG